MPGWVWNMFADTYADRPTTDPTERSTLRVSTTNVSPIATSDVDGRVAEDELDVRRAQEPRLDKPT